MGFLASLKEKHGDEWLRSTSSPFLDDARAGALPREAYAVWVAQEIPFCEEFARSLAVALYRVPSHRQDPFIDALGAVVREKAWFRRQAADLGLDESVDSRYRPAAAAFAETLRSSTGFSASPATLFATVWAVEAAYGDAWSRASPIPPQFGLGEEQWSSEWFGRWLAALEAAAEEAIAAAGAEGERDAEAAVLKVLEHERAFWKMTYEDVPNKSR